MSPPASATRKIRSFSRRSRNARRSRRQLAGFSSLGARRHPISMMASRSVGTAFRMRDWIFIAIWYSYTTSEGIKRLSSGDPPWLEPPFRAFLIWNANKGGRAMRKGVFVLTGNRIDVLHGGDGRCRPKSRSARRHVYRTRRRPSRTTSSPGSSGRGEITRWAAWLGREDHLGDPRRQVPSGHRLDDGEGAHPQVRNVRPAGRERSIGRRPACPICARGRDPLHRDVSKSDKITGEQRPTGTCFG